MSKFNFTRGDNSSSPEDLEKRIAATLTLWNEIRDRFFRGIGLVQPNDMFRKMELVRQSFIRVCSKQAKDEAMHILEHVSDQSQRSTPNQSDSLYFDSKTTASSFLPSFNGIFMQDSRPLPQMAKESLMCNSKPFTSTERWQVGQLLSLTCRLFNDVLTTTAEALSHPNKNNAQLDLNKYQQPINQLLDKLNNQNLEEDEI